MTPKTLMTSRKEEWDVGQSRADDTRWNMNGEARKGRRHHPAPDGPYPLNGTTRSLHNTGLT